MGLFSRKKNIAPERPFVSAVVVAAGNSTRMQEETNKLLLFLDGMPILAWSIRALQLCESIDEIIIVARQTDILPYWDVVRQYSSEKITQIVVGGKTRQESVANGIMACKSCSKFYVIHDGARPLVDPRDINRVIEDAFCHQAASLGVPVKDTIKVVNSEGFVRSTPERSFLVSVQTPQVFRSDLYRQAYLRNKDEAVFTDDCQLFESIGVPVFITQGSYSNIKITTPEDLAIAEALLGRRGGEIL